LFIEKNRTPDIIPLEFCLWGLEERRNLHRKVDKRDELAAHIFDAVGSIKKREDESKPTTRVLRTRVSKSRAVDGGICEHLL